MAINAYHNVTERRQTAGESVKVEAVQKEVATTLGVSARMVAKARSEAKRTGAVTDNQCLRPGRKNMYEKLLKLDLVDKLRHSVHRFIRDLKREATLHADSRSVFPTGI